MNLKAIWEMSDQVVGNVGLLPPPPLPQLGEQTDEVLEELLSIYSAFLAALKEEGIV
jgi:crotonobetainyl-CoA:carnitine CoA-transferase CaiB-like acyl-CoA transferase